MNMFDKEKKEGENNPVGVVQTQWPRVREAVENMLKLSGGNVGVLRQTLEERAQATDLEGLQRVLQSRLDGDQISGNHSFDKALFALVVNMRTVAQGNDAMRDELPLPATRMGSRTYVESFPELLLKGLFRMNRCARALGVESLEDSILQLNQSDSSVSQ